jgi:hypothetical protein
LRKEILLWTGYALPNADGTTYALFAYRHVVRSRRFAANLWFIPRPRIEQRHKNSRIAVLQGFAGDRRLFSSAAVRWQPANRGGNFGHPR